MSEKVMMRSVRVELALSDEELTNLSSTLELYGKAFGHHVGYFTAMRHVNKVRAHEIYEAVRSEAPTLPSAMVQIARNQAAEAVKAYNSNHPGKKWQKRPVYTAQSARYDSRTVSLRGSLLTFSTVDKRARSLVSLPDWFIKRYPGRKFKAASIGMDRNGQVYANLIFQVGIAPKLRAVGRTIGLDRGVIHPVMTSDGYSPSGREVRAKRRQHLFNRRTLQQKGTRSARRRLRQQSGREKRFMLDWNHKLSRALASQSGVARFVLEDLSGIHQQKKPRYAKHSNKRLSDWAHGQLLELLAYKCGTAGIELVFVSPAFTSQTCSRCKARDKAYRNRGLFKCGRCGFRADADVNAAVNIRDKYFSSLLVSEAGPSEGPIDAPEVAALVTLGARQRA